MALRAAAPHNAQMKDNSSSVSLWIETLAATRGKHGSVWAGRRKALLQKISSAPLTAASALRAYHDLLLFLVAFPDDVVLHRLASDELERIAATICQARKAGRRLADSLANTGIAHTDVAYVYTLPIARWLSQTFAANVEIAWDNETVEAALDELGFLFLPHVEQSSLLTNRMSTRDLFELGKGAGGQTVLSWILARDKSIGSGMDFFDLMNIQLRWRLSDIPASRTFCRFPRRRLSFPVGPARKGIDFGKQLAARVPKPRSLTEAEAGDLIDVARVTLSVRQRETEAVTYPNVNEVDLFQLPDGIDVAIYGMAPEQRLSVDSFFGFIAAINGVPVAYGGGFVYLHRLDIGLNIFREFRGGGSTFLFTQILRVFVQHYASTQIIIDSAQFGYGRAGGIQSGAFWFYYKMGFRPADPKLARLAEEESGRIRADTDYRTPAKTLRRFTGSNLVFNMDGTSNAPVPDMADISLAVTRHAASHYDGDRAAQAKWAERRVGRWLHVGDKRSWPATERQSFLRLCPLIALIPGPGSWSDRQKKSLIALMRAKGGPQERRFVLMLQRHRKLARALAALASASQG